MQSLVVGRAWVDYAVHLFSPRPFMGEGRGEDKTTNSPSLNRHHFDVGFNRTNQIFDGPESAG
mgnify:CR=1 FL=1